MENDHTAPLGLSIGALAEAVGVPVATLRTWESRYGYPRAVRLPSGHRRFPPDAVARLRLVSRLLEQGHRASEVVPAEPASLRALLALGQEPVPDAEDRAPREPSGLGGWFDAVERYDARALEARLQAGWNAAGALAFLEGDLARFLAEVGERWASGHFDIAREHFASAAVALFLGARWRAMSDVATGPVAVCATLPGEAHVLGLHMAAIALALAGWQIRFLGANTPVAALSAASRRVGASAVVVGSSAAADPDDVRRALAELAPLLADGVPIWAGGRAPVETGGLAAWPRGLTELTELARARRGPRGEGA